jgi:glycosyltransferase involved in cell wall biosynthesis
MIKRRLARCRAAVTGAAAILDAMPTPRPRATVLVPTRDRPDDLKRCLVALNRQTVADELEVIVIDDGSETSVHPVVTAVNPAFRVVRCEGRGPARARNAGAAEARGPLLLLTDDDVEPCPQWAEAACSHLERHVGHAGVEGPVSTPPWDPLYAYSLISTGPGAYLTCNVAYRASVFDRVGGFYEDWPTLECEDHDLAFRILREEPIGFEPQMAVVHHPRPQSLGQIAARGLRSESAILLFERHPDRFSAGFGRKWLRATIYTIRWWARVAQGSPIRLMLHPHQAFRFLCVATAQTICSVLGVSRAAASRVRSGVNQGFSI